MAAHDHRNDSNGYLYIALGVGAVGMFVALAAVASAIGPAAIPIWAMTLGGMWMLARSPIGQAIGTRISGHPPEGSVLDVPQEVYAELDELRARIGELEERTDFAERLLSRQADGQGNS